MLELKDLRTSSKKGETRSWTQKVPERKMSDDEDRRIEVTRSKKGESRNWTQKEPARKMFNDEAYRLESKEKETRSRTQDFYLLIHS